MSDNMIREMAMVVLVAMVIGMWVILFCGRGR